MSRMGFKDVAVGHTELGEEAWDLISHYSCSCANTGFTAGTADKANLSKHAKFRMLERGVDDYLIRHVLARGDKAPAQNGGWRFEKDGVVVIASSELPADGQLVLTTFKVGFVSDQALGEAQAEYDALLDGLQQALGEDERLAVLIRTLGDECARILLSVDLERSPPDRPLLFHCAEMGYAECVRHLLAVGGWNPGGMVSHKCTLLHIAAYAGQVDVACAETLGSAFADLCDIYNDFKELPEDTAWNQYVGDTMIEDERADDELEQDSVPKSGSDDNVNSRGLGKWLHIALACRNTRLNVEDSCEAHFLAKATREFELTSPLDSRCIMRSGVELSSVLAHFREGVALRHNLVLAYQLGLQSNPSALAQLLSPLRSNHFLMELRLCACGLGPAHCALLAEFLQTSARVSLVCLDLQRNSLGTEGLGVLAGAARLLDIDTLNLSAVGMREDGLLGFAQTLARHAPRIGKFALRKLSLKDNDLSDAPAAGHAVHSAGFEALFDVLERTGIASLILNKTRLTANQVATICRCLPAKTPGLATLDLVGLDFSQPDIYQAVVQMVRDIDRLSGGDGKCSAEIGKGKGKAKGRGEGFTLPAAAFALKRIGLDQLKYPKAWQNLRGLLAGRLKRVKVQEEALKWQREGHGNVSAGSILQLHPGRPVMRAGEAIQHRSQCLAVPMVVACTPNGAVRMRDPSNLFETLSVRHGQLVECILKYDRQARALKLEGARADVQGEMEACLASVDVLLYRPGPGSGTSEGEARGGRFLLRSPASHGARELRFRLQTGVLSEQHELEQRFPNAFPRLLPRLTFQLLMEGLDIQTFTDDEVAQLASLTQPDSFVGFMGGTRGTEQVSLKAASAASVPVVAELQVAFRSEELRRASEQISVPRRECFYDFWNWADKEAGDRERQWFFPAPVFRAGCDLLKSHFAPTAALGQTSREGPTQTVMPWDSAMKDCFDARHCCTRDVVDVHGLWKKRLVLVTVPEGSIDASNDLPLGLVLKPNQRYLPTWVSQSSLSEHLGEYSKSGYPDICSEIETLVAEAEQGGARIELLPASVVKDSALPPPAPPEGSQGARKAWKGGKWLKAARSKEENEIAQTRSQARPQVGFGEAGRDWDALRRRGVQ